MSDIGFDVFFCLGLGTGLLSAVLYFIDRYLERRNRKRQEVEGAMVLLAIVAFVFLAVSKLNHVPNRNIPWQDDEDPPAYEPLHGG